jgi:hypothetical protein
MYEVDGRKFRLGRVLTQGGKPSPARDLPRFSGNPPDDNRPALAIIGDKRNDQNVIISQLHGVFLQFHNCIAGEMIRKNPDVPFSEIQRVVRWHYQYIVLNDFLPRIVGEDTMKKVLPEWRDGLSCTHKPQLCFYHYHDYPFIPIEFSAAAYRFGHSMVRPIYRLNTLHDGGKNPSSATQDEIDSGLAGRFFIFAGVQRRGLGGFAEFPSDWAIDWSLYFDMSNLDEDGVSTEVGKRRVQPAYKIDTSLVNPLAFLPEFSDDSSMDAEGAVLTLEGKPKDNLRLKQRDDDNPSNLAVRNLLRGASMGLPSGQDVARAMGEIPLTDEELVIGKAQLDEEGKEEFQLLNDFKVELDGEEGEFKDRFISKAPLWYYILAEAHSQWRKDKDQWRKDKDQKKNKTKHPNEIPVTLGPVGGRFVAETIVGLLLGDSHSYLNQHPKWTPQETIGGKWMRQHNGKWIPETPNEKKSPEAPRWYRFTMGDFIKYALDLREESGE